MEKSKNFKKVNNRKYYLHRCAKKAGLHINRKMRMITASDNELLTNKYAVMLDRECGYVRQLSIN